MSDIKQSKSQLESLFTDAANLVEKAKDIELNKANVNTAIDLAREYGNSAYNNFNLYNKEPVVIEQIAQTPLKPLKLYKERTWFSKLMNVVIAVLSVLLVVAFCNVIYTVFSNPEPFSLENAAGSLLLHLIF